MAVAVAVAMTLIAQIPDVDARSGARGGGGHARGGGSVRHSGSRSRRGHSSSRSRGGARSQPTRGGGARAQPAQGGGERTQPAPGGRPGGGAGPGGGNRQIGSGNQQINVNVNRGGGRGVGAHHARGAHRHAHGRYAARRDARRDWYRWRRNRALFAVGVALLTRPRYCTTVVVPGGTYCYWGGVYYSSVGTRYVVAAPPRGAVVYAVPTYTTVVYVGSTPYYYSDGAYYVATSAPAPEPEIPEDEVIEEGEQNPPMTEDDHNYQVVPPPVGATVPYLPDEAERKVINGKTYMVYQDAWYRPFVSDGDTIYQAVEAP
jgi:hypothetical protein